MSTGSYDPRITAYFGDAVLRAGFMPLPHLFLRHYHTLGLGHGEALFVLQLMEINWDLAAPPKTVNDLAQRLGVNARTVRRYSEVVADLGLIILYDQYDDTGAQIENGYDLSPLFARLAAFAPEPPRGGQIRRARRMAVANTESEDVTTERTRRAAPDKTVPSPDIGDIPPPGIDVTPSPDIGGIPPPDIGGIPRPDTLIRPPVIRAPGLKTEQRIPKKQKNRMHDVFAPCMVQPDSVDHEGEQSLRQVHTLTLNNSTHTDSILQRIGIDLPVRARIRATLTLADAWTLWAYALAKRWSTPLLINEVYDKVSKQGRPAAFTRRFEEVGRALALLDPDRAERLLRMVSDYCPSAPVEPFAEFVGPTPAPEMVAALEKVWHMFTEVRNTPGKPHPLVRHVNRVENTAPDHQVAWAAVLEHLASKVAPHEFTTWLQETMLLDLETTRAVVGTSNVFARDYLAATHRPLIEQTLHSVLGRIVEVDIVIGVGVM